MINFESASHLVHPQNLSFSISPILWEKYVQWVVEIQSHSPNKWLSKDPYWGNEIVFLPPTGHASPTCHHDMPKVPCLM